MPSGQLHVVRRGAVELFRALLLRQHPHQLRRVADPQFQPADALARRQHAARAQHAALLDHRPVQHRRNSRLEPLFGPGTGKHRLQAFCEQLAIAFGNFRAGYLVAERSETAILRDPYTNKPFVSFYATKRVGGAVVNSEAIKVMRISVS